RNGDAFRVRRRGVARIDFNAGGGFELIDQVVRLHALTFSTAHFDVRLLFVFLGNFVAHFLRATRRERDYVVSEMLQVIGLFGVSEGAQPLRDDALRVRLAVINDVV